MSRRPSRTPASTRGRTRGTSTWPTTNAVAREAELREAQLIAARADELQALRELGTLEQTEPREGDEAVRDELTRRAGSYVPSTRGSPTPWPRTSGTTG